MSLDPVLPLRATELTHVDDAEGGRMQPALLGWQDEIAARRRNRRLSMRVAGCRVLCLRPETSELFKPSEHPLTFLQYFPRLQAHHVDSVRSGGQDSGEQGRGRGVCDQELRCASTGCIKPPSRCCDGCWRNQEWAHQVMASVLETPHRVIRQ